MTTLSFRDARWTGYSGTEAQFHNYEYFPTGKSREWDGPVPRIGDWLNLPDLGIDGTVRHVDWNGPADAVIDFWPVHITNADGSVEQQASGVATAAGCLAGIITMIAVGGIMVLLGSLLPPLPNIRLDWGNPLVWLAAVPVSWLIFMSMSLLCVGIPVVISMLVSDRVDSRRG
jgi:hypothetical protein